MSPEETNAQLMQLLTEQSKREADRAEREEKRHLATIRAGRAKMFLIGLIFVVPIFAYSISLTQFLDKARAPHVAVVELHGAIGDSDEVTRIVTAMDTAMKNPRSKGLIIDINSPGGSPAQSERMRLKIEELVKKYPDKPIECVGGDYIASGGYLVASGCPRLTVLPSTLTGSIGVIHQSFGLKHLAEKLDVNVRTITAGQNKAFMNEFGDWKPEHDQFIKAIADNLHGVFIDYVRRGRGDRLHETPDMFSGYLWVGSEALKMGLVDQIGTIDQVIAQKFDGAEKRYYGKPSPLDFLKTMGASVSTAVSLVSAQMSADGRFQ